MRRVVRPAIAITALITILSGCQLYAVDYNEEVTEYAIITDSGDLSVLDQYPNLEYVIFAEAPAMKKFSLSLKTTRMSPSGITFSLGRKELTLPILKLY